MEPALGSQRGVIADAARRGEKWMPQTFRFDAWGIVGGQQFREGIFGMFARVTGEGGERFKFGQAAQPHFNLRSKLCAPGFNGERELGFPEEEFADSQENKIVPRFQPGMELRQALDCLRGGKAVAMALRLHSAQAVAAKGLALEAAQNLRQPAQFAWRNSRIAHDLMNRTPAGAGQCNLAD